MSTLAELLVKINGDSQGLSKELQKTKSDINNAFSINPIAEMAGALTSATNGLSGFVNKLSAVSAVVASGFGLSKIVESAVESGEAVYQLATKYGLSAEEGAKLNKIIKLTGGDVDSFATTMTRLDKTFSMPGQSGEKVREVLDLFGVSLTDSSGKLLPLNEQLAEMSKGFKVASDNGLEQEFIMATLGAKGLNLVRTFKDYDEAARNASKTKGIGIDPQQIHELDQQIKIASMQAGTLGTAFTGALAPVAVSVFPTIIDGLYNTASVLSENKGLIADTSAEILKVVVAYKAVSVVNGMIGTIGDAWRAASIQALAAAETATIATSSLTSAQERSIDRAVAASSKGYAKMEADAVKAAQAQGLSAQETAVIIAEECAKISASATEAANAIRIQMTESFMAVNAEASASTALVSEGFATQGMAATAAGEKTVVSSTAAKEALATQAIIQNEVTAATVASGDAAVVTGERTVGAMAIARVGAGNFLSSLWALAGGWLGVAAATAVAIDALMDYLSAKNKVESYDKKAEVYDDPDRPGMHLKKQWVDHEVNSDEIYASGYGGNIATSGYEKVSLSEAEEEEQSSFQKWKADMENNKPWRQKATDPSLLENFKNAIANDPKEHKEKQDKSGEKLEKAAERVHESIRKEWVSTTQGRVDQAEEWYKTELQELNKSASANEEYETDLQRINEIYARKRTQALYEEQKEKNSINDSMYDSARSLQERMSKLSLPMMTNSSGGMEPSKVASDLQNVQNEYDAAITKIQNKYRDLEGTYEAASAKEQAIYRDAWAKNGIDFEIVEQGKVNFKKQIDKESVASEQEKDQKIRAINVARKQWEESQESARNAGNLTDFQTTLTSEQALLAQDLAGRQEMIDSYYAAWKETHRSTMSYVSTLSQGVGNSFKSFVSDSISGTSSISEAWDNLGSNIGKVIGDMVAEWIAAQIQMAAMNLFMGILGFSSGGGVGLSSPSDGYAWPTWEAATGGFISGPGTGTSDSIPAWLSDGEFVMTAKATSFWGANNLAAMNAGRMPKFASGGIVAGPSLASLGSGSIRTTSLPTLETKDISSAPGQINMPPINIIAWDGKSAHHWVKNGGGDMIMSYINQANKKNPYGKR